MTSHGQLCISPWYGYAFLIAVKISGEVTVINVSYKVKESR